MTEQTACLEKLYDFNATRPSELARRTELLKDMFAEIGENCYIEPPLHANWGGKHVHFGKNVYANFNLTLVDDTHIYVGDGTMLAPNVVLATAAHPILPELREKQYQFNLRCISARIVGLAPALSCCPAYTSAIIPLSVLEAS